MAGEPAHKEPQVTTDEFIARNGKSGKSTRDDAQQVLRYERARWRENVRVHIPTFPVTPGVSDIFRRGDIYSCFGFLSLPPFPLGTVSNGSCPPPRHSGTPNFDDMCIQSARPRHAITSNLERGHRKSSGRSKSKTESLPVLSPLLFQVSRMRFCMQFRRHDGWRRSIWSGLFCR